VLLWVEKPGVGGGAGVEVFTHAGLRPAEPDPHIQVGGDGAELLGLSLRGRYGAKMITGR
jgi:hypothetical protein